MFDVERFVADCGAASAEDPTRKVVREVLGLPIRRLSSMAWASRSAPRLRSFSTPTSSAFLTSSGRRALWRCRITIACGR